MRAIASAQKAEASINTVMPPATVAPAPVLPARAPLPIRTLTTSPRQAPTALLADALRMPTASNVAARSNCPTRRAAARGEVAGDCCARPGCELTSAVSAKLARTYQGACLVGAILGLDFDTGILEKGCRQNASRADDNGIVLEVLAFSPIDLIFDLSMTVSEPALTAASTRMRFFCLARPNASLRQESVTVVPASSAMLAAASRALSLSLSLSPPPTTTTCCPRYSSGSIKHRRRWTVLLPANPACVACRGGRWRAIPHAPYACRPCS